MSVAASREPSLTRSAPSFRPRNHGPDTLWLRRVFDMYDTNHDGEISCQDLCQALNLLGPVADEADVSSTISAYLKPGRSGLDFEDFRSLHGWVGDGLLPGEEGAEEEDLRDAFTVFDEDGDGFISAVELQSVLRKLGLEAASDMWRVKDMIRSVDKNGDGRVDLQEFKHMMRNVSFF